MGFIEAVARAGGNIKDEDMAMIARFRDVADKRVKDALIKYNTIKSQAERIAYLESRVMELKEEVRKARQR